MTAVSTADGRPIGARALAIAPGLALAAGIALVAGILSGIVPSSIPPVTIAIGLGIVVGQFVASRTATLAPGLAFTSQRILRLGIVLLGARLSFEQIARIGIPAAVVVVVTMAAALTLVLVLARLASVEPRLAVLLAVGAAVCGNSAVVATAPVIAARSRDVAFAVATVTLFGTAAVFIYPIIGHAIPLTDPAFGLWSGIAINDTSQVVAASAAFSPDALDVATVVKLIRNALMAPLLVGIAWAWARTRRRGRRHERGRAQGRAPVRARVRGDDRPAQRRDHRPRAGGRPRVVVRLVHPRRPGRGRAVDPARRPARRRAPGLRGRARSGGRHRAGDADRDHLARPGEPPARLTARTYGGRRVVRVEDRLGVDRHRAATPPRRDHGDDAADRRHDQDRHVDQQRHREGGVAVDAEAVGDPHRGQLERAEVARPGRDDRGERHAARESAPWATVSSIADGLAAGQEDHDRGAPTPGR